jgi:hypothetical protein
MRALCLATATIVLAATVGLGSVEATQRKTSDTSSHPSTTGQAERSSVATKQGANNPKFCPPGQRKKPGKGSAFKC